MQSLPIIVFSHLRWDFVFQRPQHLLSRLAKSRRIIFVEEPIHAECEAHWEKNTSDPNVTVYRPRTNLRSHGFTNEQIQIMQPMVQQMLQQEGITDYVVWAYTAMAYPLVAALEPKAVVFDVMD